MSDTDDIFPGTSAMSALMRAHDWSQTELGAPKDWPEALKAPLRLMLMSRFEMWLGWGEDLTFFYNDAYIPTLGIKHPNALGQPMAIVWQEVFDAVKDRITSVMRDGVATWDEGLLLLLDRNGYPEETYHTFSYSPIISNDQRPCGLMCVVSEETERVISERRLKLLNDLSTALLGAKSRTALRAAIAQTFAAHARDFPFGALTLVGDGEKASGIECLAKEVGPGSAPTVVLIERVLADPPRGAWDIAPRDAIVIAIEGAGQSGTIGSLILGLNPYRPLDEATRDFATLLARQVAGAIAAIDAATAERLEIERLRDLFAQSPSFIAVLRGPTHRFEFTNPGYAQLTGHRDVVGLTVREALPEVEGQGFFELLDSVYASGEAFIGQSMSISIQRIPGAEPEPRMLDFVYQPIIDDAGTISGIFVEGIDVTSAHDAVMALRASEEQFRTFAQAVPNQAWTATPDGLLDWFNDRVSEYSGRQTGTLTGEGWLKIVHPDDLLAAGNSWAAALASAETYETEFRIRRHDGQYRWHLVRALPMRGADGTVTRWVGTNTDIHDQKLNEVETLRDRDRLWALSQDLMLICDFNGLISSVNPSAMRMLGWDEAEMVGHRVNDFIHPEDISASAGEVDKLACGATTIAFENRYRTKQGEYRLIAWTAVPDEHRIHAVGRDVTDERSLERDRERIWALSPVVKVVAAGTGEIVAVNPSWTTTLGWSAAETIGRNVLDFVAADLDAAHERLKALAEPGRRVVESQSVFRARDGNERRFAWTAVPEGGMLYLFGRDITAETETATALASAEEALRQAQKMEAVGQLTGGIAHDFNNMLTGVIGSLDLVERNIASGRTERVGRYIEAANTSAQRAAALTARLLAFGRRQSLDLQATDVNARVAGMEELLHRTLGEQIALETHLKPDLWPAFTDAHQLESALLNLCINARDAMPDGGILVIETANTTLDDRYVRDHPGLEVGDYVVLGVSDTGTGMDAAMVDKVFEPFFTTKPVGQGTGLGLSMIYGFARQSGGHVRIYSELGRGTTVKLYVPRFRGKVHAAEVKADGAPRGAGEMVMVVEDDPSVRMIVLEVLEELGYGAIEAVDGRGAIPILQSDRVIDLLVTDVGLPGINGRQLAEVARQSRPDLKILFITGYAETATVRSGFLEAGMDMMTKPFAVDALATKLRTILESQG